MIKICFHKYTIIKTEFDNGCLIQHLKCQKKKIQIYNFGRYGIY
jgi:hypothetical protein